MKRRAAAVILECSCVFQPQGYGLRFGGSPADRRTGSICGSEGKYCQRRRRDFRDRRPHRRPCGNRSRERLELKGRNEKSGRRKDSTAPCGGSPSEGVRDPQRGERGSRQAGRGETGGSQAGDRELRPSVRRESHCIWGNQSHERYRLFRICNVGFQRIRL